MFSKDSPEIERRFLLFTLPDLSQVETHDSFIEQTYLLSPADAVDETHRVRKRVASDSVQSVEFFYTVKTPRPDGARQERENEIDAKSYAELLARAIPSQRTIQKTRHVFIHEGHTLEFDVFAGDLAGLFILEVELDAFDTPLALPDWLAPRFEITSDPWFSNSNLSRVTPAEVWARVAEQRR